MTKKLPSIQPKDSNHAIDFVFCFFAELGWDAETENLDPMKVEIHPTTWGKYCDLMRELWDLPGAYTWMNYGPSGDNVQLGLDEVKILPGAFEKILMEG